MVDISSEWSNQPVIEPSLESQKETFVIQIVASTVDTTTKFDWLLEKHEVHKALKNFTWVSRFIHNYSYTKQKGSLKNINWK